MNSTYGGCALYYIVRRRDDIHVEPVITRSNITVTSASSTQVQVTVTDATLDWNQEFIIFAP